MNKIKAVLFDLDGVLFNGAPLHFQALNLALGEYGYAPIGIEEHKQKFDGLPTREKLAVLKSVGRIQSEHVEGIKKAKQTNTRILLRATVKFHPDIYCLIAGIEKYGLKWGVVTNAVVETAHIVLGILGIGTYDVLVTNEDCTPKPDPAPYRLAAKMLELEPDECLVIEDGKYGVESARRAGCKVMEVAGPHEVSPRLVFVNL